VLTAMCIDTNSLCILADRANVVFTETLNHRLWSIDGTELFFASVPYRDTIATAKKYSGTTVAPNMITNPNPET